MIDITNEIEENYPSIDLEEIQEIQPELPDDLLNSIHLYNKALNDIKSGSEDIAVIGLKKAISLNPGFHEAMNLLGICYLKLNQKEQAKGVFNKVANSEKNGIRALDYINDIDGGSSTTTVGKKNKKSNGIGTKLSLWISRSLNVETGLDIMKYIVGLVVGIVLVSVIWYAMPEGKPLLQFTKNDEVTITQLQQKTNELEKANTDIKVYQEKISELENSLASIEDEKLILKKAEEARSLIRNAVEEKKYLEAADKLIELKASNELDSLRLTTEFNDLFETLPQLLYNQTKERFLITSAIVKDVDKVSDESYKAFEQQAKAYETIAKFEGDYEFITSLYYYMGKCYQAMASVNAKAENIQKAKEAYNKVLQLPDVGNAQWAQYRINEINIGKFWW